MAATKSHPKESTVPIEIIDKAKQDPNKLPQYSKGRVSALGVLAEIDTVLQNHKNSFSPKLTGDLSPKIKELLPRLGIKNLSDEQLNRIAQEVAAETSRQTLEDAHKIQNISQINDLVADSLTQTLITHPEIFEKIKSDPAKVFEKVWEQTNDVSNKNQDSLEKAAVLANLDQIAQLQKPNQQTEETLTIAARDAVEAQEPLGESALQESVKSSLKTYLSKYVEDVDARLSILPDGQTPNLEQLQKVKYAAHENATKVQEDKQLGTKIDYQKTTGTLAQALNTAHIPQTASAPNLPPIVQTIINNPTYGKQLYFAALGHDEESLGKGLKEKSEIIERLKKKKSLSFKEAKELSEAKLYWTKYAQAQALKVKQPKRYQTLLAILSKMGDGRPEIASQSVWQSERFLQAKMPKIYAYNERLAAGAAFGKLGFNIGGGNIGSIFSNIKGHISASSMLGMGMAPTKAINNLRNKVTAIIGAPFAATMLYLMSLGQAAVTGAIAGMSIGGIVGAAIPVAFLGPAGVLLWPVTVPLGILMGGTAGALIGLGIAAGSATMISMGTAGATGALIGGYIGFGVGTGVGVFLAGICIASVICAPFAPFIVIGSGAIGTAIGAAIGFVVGLATGYLIGKFLISPLISGFKSALGSIGSGASAGAGLLHSLGSIATSLLHSGIGAISSIGSGALGMLSSGLGSLVSSGFGLFAGTASAMALPVFTTVGVVSATGVFVGVIIPATIFSTVASEEGTPATPGENQFFTLTKTTDNQNLPNPPPDHSLTFTITLTAKETRLTNINISDKINVQGETSSFEATHGSLSPGPCPTELDVNQSCSYSYQVNVNSSFQNSVISNTATVSTTPEGQTSQTESITVTVIVGTPPAQCPRQWPAIGFISQGPEGATSHGNPAYGEYEALDIAQGIGNDVFATVEGTVTYIELAKAGDPNDNRIYIQPTSCAGLSVINYWHLSEILISQGQTVTFGKKIGKTGAWQGAAHIHYQFNETGNRSFRIESPHVPITVPRRCDGQPECGNVIITSAP